MKGSNHPTSKLEEEEKNQRRPTSPSFPNFPIQASKPSKPKAPNLPLPFLLLDHSLKVDRMRDLEVRVVEFLGFWLWWSGEEEERVERERNSELGFKWGEIPK